MQSREVVGASLAALRAQFDGLLKTLVQDKDRGALYRIAVILGASWKDESKYTAAIGLVGAPDIDEDTRLSALNALIAAGQAGILKDVARVLANRKFSADFRGEVLSSLTRLDDPKVGELVVAAYPALEPALQPGRAVELLTQRSRLGRRLLERQIGGGSARVGPERQPGA